MKRASVLRPDVDEALFGTGVLAASTSVAARKINFMVGIPSDTPLLTVDRACRASMACIGLAD